MYDDPRKWVCCQMEQPWGHPNKSSGIHRTQKTYLNRSGQWADTMKACRCSGCLPWYRSGLTSLVNAHWGKCCWCTVKVLRLRQGVLPFGIGSVWSYGGHEKLVVDCEGNDHDFEADAQGDAQWGWDDLGISRVLVGAPPLNGDPAYFVYLSGDVDCACANSMVAKIRAEAPGGYPYVTWIHDCRDYARDWFDRMMHDCHTR